MKKISVACVQLCSSDNLRENIATASALIREAKAQGAELIATPEMTSLLDRRPGAVLRQAKSEEEDEALAAFCALAQELDVWLVIGSLPIRAAEDKCTNRSLLISPQGMVAARYDKIHLFDATLAEDHIYKESERYQAGDRAVIADLPHARLGFTICYDLRFPQLFRALAHAGAEIITVPAAFVRVTGEAHWEVLLRARAIETGCFLLAPAQGGCHADGRETYGHSLIVGPWGEVLAEAGVEPGVITATLDLDQVKAARSRLPSLGHDRVFVGPLP